MKNIFSVVIIVLFVCFFNKANSQITGGGSSAPTTAEAQPISKGGDAISSNVNLFNGVLQASYSLGSVSTPTGLTYTQTLSYNSSYATGDNTPFMTGIPYGEGWSLNVPYITINTASKHKYQVGQYEEYERSVLDDPSQDIIFTPEEAKEEGSIEFFSPEINIPGVASGRLVFKGYTYLKNTATVHEAVFVLNEFSSQYIEVKFDEYNNWTAVLPDGTKYVFQEKKYTVLNASNQRFGNDQGPNPPLNDAGISALNNAKDPKKVATTWYVSYIENPSQHQKYRIAFQYKKLGKFDFHQEQVYFDQVLFHGQVPTTEIYNDIFLENVSAIYTEEQFTSVKQEYAVTEFEKIDFIYEEDFSIRKPTGLSSLPGILYSNDPNVTVHDELYNKVLVYDAKSQQNQFQNWRRYEHIRRDQSSSQSFSPTNPYLGTDNNYLRRAVANAATILFDHSFLESPKIDLEKTGTMLNMPPGDIYEVYTEIGGPTGNDNLYCNFDINIVSGSGDKYPSPALTTQQNSAYDKTSYDLARNVTLFTTFGNQSKWNPNFQYGSGGILKTTNLFVMPNLPTGFGGFFVQIGAGNSDNIFDISNYDLSLLASGTGQYQKVLQSYPHVNPGVENTPYWVNRKTATIPYNFGIGLPWYNEHRLLKYNFGTFPDPNSSLPIDKIYSNWYLDPGENGSHQPTLTKQGSGQYSLYALKIYRYSKKPYVLKKIKHYKLKGDGVGGVKAELYQDNIIELKYAIVEAGAYENTVMNVEPSAQSTRVEVSKRYIITLVQIEDASSSSTVKKTTVDFDYQLTPPTTQTSLVQDYNTNFYSYVSNGENTVLTRITNPLGKQTFISYYGLNESATTRIKLSSNKYRYYPDPKKPWAQSQVPVIYMGPSEAYMYNRAVKEIKTEVAHNASSNQFSVIQYSYANFKALKEPQIPLYSPNTLTTNPSTYKYRAHSQGKEIHGFEICTQTFKSNSSASVEKTIITKHNYSQHLFGKVINVLTYSGSGTTSNDLLSEDTYTYEVVHAFKNGLKRPGYAGLHFDYQDYWETEGVVLPGMSGPVSSGYSYASSYKVAANDVGTDAVQASKLNIQPTVSKSLASRDMKTPEVKFLESRANQAAISSANPDYSDAYFIKLIKKESKLHDLGSQKTTTSIEEYDYFDADYTGRSTSKGYDYILKTESSVSTPHRLLFIPSWMHYSTTTYNIEAPDKKTVSENFYYYDLKNQYGCFTPGFDNLPPFTDDNLIHGSNYLLSKGVMDFTVVGLAALSYSNHYGIRSILMENRKRGYKTNFSNHIHSTYYIYVTVPDASDFRLNTSPFTISNGTFTNPPSTDPYNPKPGVVVGVSGNLDNPNTWGSTDPLQMGPPPTVDPNIRVIYYGSNGTGNWFSNPVNPEASHEMVKLVYNETTTSAGEKIHAYLSNLNTQITITLDEYLKAVDALKIVNDIIPSYNINNKDHFELGNFMLRGVYMVNDQIKAYPTPLSLSTYLDSVDTDSLNAIVYSTDYPYKEFNRKRFNVPNPEDGPIVNDIYSDALRLSEILIQTDEVVSDEFTQLNQGYNTTSLPPILQFDFRTYTVGTNGTFRYFAPVFPYKTLVTKHVNKLNYLGGIEEEVDRNGLITKNELFENQLILLKESGVVKDQKYYTHPFGVIKTSTVAYGQTGQNATNYEYYPTGQLKKITYSNGNTESFEYDELHRIYKTYKDNNLLSVNRYSIYPVTSIFNNPDMLSNRSADYALTSINFETRALANYNETEQFFDNLMIKGVVSRSYIDPLGRAHQTATQKIVNGASNPKVYENFTYHTGKLLYDSRNMPYRMYKPFEYNTGNTVFGLQIQTNSAPNQLFEETAYETNVLARPVEVTDFGVSMTDPTRKTAKKEYAWLDKAGIVSELNLTATEQALLMPLYTTKNYIFFKTKDLDQDGKEVITYVDAAGAKIATKAFVDVNTPTITLMINNSQGLVDKVINPEKQESTYKYNILGWKYEEQTPDKGLTRYMFNKSGQVSLMQDENARQGTNNSSLPYYIKSEYDLFGRITETSRVNVRYNDLNIVSCGGITGICAQLSPLGHINANTTYSNSTEGVCYNETFTSSKTLDWQFITTSWAYSQCNNIAIYNIEVSNFIDLSSKKLITQSYYNTKPALANAHSLADNTNFPLSNTLGRLTTSIAYNAAGDPIQYKYFSYRADGLLDKELHQFNEEGITLGAASKVVRIEYPNYSHTGKLLTKNVYLQTNLSSFAALTFAKQYHYEFDGFDRLKEIYFNNGTFGSAGTKIASYQYNNTFGFVEKISYYGFNDNGCKDLLVDEINYTRTADDRNRLTEINSKFFEWHMYYDAEQPTLTNTGFNNAGHLPQATSNYNGNINFTIARYKIDPVLYPNTPPVTNAASSNLFKGITIYGYEYDGLNRLVNADATIGDQIIQNGVNTTSTQLQYGDVSYTYDKIGNITNLIRYNNVNDPATAPSPLYHNMTYNYVAGTNKLNTITEVNNSRNTTYGYDNNGNISSDNYRAIYNTQYNEGNLPYQLTAGGKDILYLYDEGGFRLYKEVVDGGNTTKEYYVKDATGKVVAIIDLQTPQIMQWNVDGIAKAKPAVTGQELYFYINDHLNNTRLTYKPNVLCYPCPSTCSIDGYSVENIVDYYPFGKKLREYIPAPYGNEKYLTTGNERDIETDWDYRNARYYDAEIGRFLAVDPLAIQRLWLNSYNYVQNNPLGKIDPEGSLDWEPDGNGNLVAQKGDDAFSLAQMPGWNLGLAYSMLRQNNIESVKEGDVIKDVGSTSWGFPTVHHLSSNSFAFFGYFFGGQGSMKIGNAISGYSYTVSGFGVYGYNFFANNNGIAGIYGGGGIYAFDVTARLYSKKSFGEISFTGNVRIGNIGITNHIVTKKDYREADIGFDLSLLSPQGTLSTDFLGTRVDLTYGIKVGAYSGGMLYKYHLDRQNQILNLSLGGKAAQIMGLNADMGLTIPYGKYFSALRRFSSVGTLITY